MSSQTSIEQKITALADELSSNVEQRAKAEAEV